MPYVGAVLMLGEWVDFTYKGRTWSFPGRGNYNLNELLGVIGIEVPDEGVENLMLSLIKGDSIEGALYLTEEEDGWHINSDNPFSSTYVLSFDIGSTHYSLTVTDAVETTDLNNLITNFQISGAEPNGDGTYTVKPGKQYSMDITFTESESTYQFSGNKMTLTIPSGLELKTINSPFSITVNYLGNNIVIPGNIATIEGGNLCIKLDTGDTNYSKLAAITTAQIKVHATGEFTKTGFEHDITIPGGGTYHVDESPDVSITKSARITDFDNGIIEYVLKLTSKGSNNGVTVKDTLEGTALTGYNTSSVKLYRNGSEVSGYSTSFGNDNKSFELHTPALQDGEYEIRYTVNLNKNGLTQDGNGYGIPNDTKNTAEVPGKPPATHSFNHIVDQHSASKNAGNSETGSDGQGKTSWTITAYTAPLITDGRLTYVTDRIKTPDVSYDTSEPIQVRITDVATGTVKTVELPWSSVTTYEFEGKPAWEYDFSGLPGYDNTGKYWRYDITYKTVTDMSHATQSKEIKNEGGPEDDQHEATGTAVVPEANRTGIEKSFSSINLDEGTAGTVTWRIVLTIPAAGVAGPDVKVIEHLPSYGQYKDTYVPGSFNLVKGYGSLGNPAEINTLPDGDVEFIWNGFPQSNEKQTVIFTFKTYFNPDWIGDENAPKEHRNEAVFNNDHRWAVANYSEPLLEKVGSEFIVEDGEIYYDFDVKTNKISESSFGVDGTGTIEFTDQYDSHLEYVAGSAWMYGGDEEYNISLSDGHSLPGSAIDTSTENTIKFTLSKDMLPKKQGQLPDGTWGSTGELCNYYRLHYRMKVTNADALASEALQQNSLTVKMGNSVTFNGETKETTVEYTPNVLDKWQSKELNSDTANHNGKVQFTIHVNEAQADLEDGDVLTLYDQLTNISTAYQDIQISFPKGNYQPGDIKTTVEGKDEPEGLPYFNMQNDKITFYLPDGVDTIITYWAKPTGELGSDGKIHYTNTATLKGYEKKVEESADFSGEAVGLATQYGVNLYKADGYVNSNMLKGAEFKLFIVDEEDEDGNIISGTPLKDKFGNDKIIKAEKPDPEDLINNPGNINENETIRIEGTWEKDGWNLRPEQRYYLLEVKAPEGYAIDTTKYSFTISAKGFTNYSRDSIAAPDGSGAIIKPWTFYNGDVLTVKDWPKKGELEITKNFDPSGDVTSYAELNDD